LFHHHIYSFHLLIWWVLKSSKYDTNHIPHLSSNTLPFLPIYTNAIS